jgi:hypothetical protein
MSIGQSQGADAKASFLQLGVEQASKNVEK